MIRVKYTPVCDLCEAECPSEEFSCTGDNRHPYPVPIYSERHTCSLGYTLQICDSCREPIEELIHKLIEDAVEARSKT